MHFWIWSLFPSLVASRSSRSPPTRFVPLSDHISFVLSPFANEPLEGVYERASVERVCNLNVHCSNGQTREDAAVALNGVASPFDEEWSKVVNACVGEGRFTFCHSTTREVRRLLHTWLRVSLLAHEAVSQYASNRRSATHDGFYGRVIFCRMIGCLASTDPPAFLKRPLTRSTPSSDITGSRRRIALVLLTCCRLAPVSSIFICRVSNSSLNDCL